MASESWFGSRSRKKTKAPRIPKDLAVKDKTAASALSRFFKKAPREYKLLLLGAGESGKTTILKQIQLIHGNGFDQNVREEHREYIQQNVLEGMITLIKAQSIVGIEVSSEESKNAARYIVEYHQSMQAQRKALEFTTELAEAINLLWMDPDVQKIFHARSEFNLHECFDQFADSLQDYPAWGGPRWIPRDMDILRCRVRTVGIVDSKYSINGGVFRVVDVGGQRSERKKWMQLFDGVTGVLFVAAMSGYDQKMFEDNTANRLEESLKLWEEISNLKQFTDSALVLLLNKFDLFVEKYKTKAVPINYSGKFVEVGGEQPKAEEDDELCTNARTWFKKLFASLVKDFRRKSLFIHITTALDPTNMEEVISAVTLHVLRKNFQAKGFV